MRQPTELGETRSKIGPLEDGVSGDEPSLPWPRIGPKAIRLLPSGTQVRERVNPSPADAVPGCWVDVRAESIQVRHLYEIHARCTSEFDLPPEPRVDFDELVPPCCLVTLELGIEEAAIAHRREEATEAIGRMMLENA